MPNPRRRWTIRELAFLALIAVLSMVTKPYVKGVVNVITQPLGIPGGVAAGTIYMFWVVLAGYMVGRPGSVFFFSLLQGILALMMGFTGPLGALIIVSYALPGIAVEVLYLSLGLVWGDCRQASIPCILAGAVANISGAVANAILMFSMGGSLVLVLSPIAAVTGGLGGFLAFVAGTYLVRALGIDTLSQNEATSEGAGSQ
ncbi:MAG: ECF transporter S component [Bacillota bacterium]